MSSSSDYITGNHSAADIIISPNDFLESQKVLNQVNDFIDTNYTVGSSKDKSVSRM